MNRSATHRAWVLVTLLFLSSGSAHAAPADLDPTFGDGGVFAAPVQTILPSGETSVPLALDHAQRPVLAVLQDSIGDGTGLHIAVIRLTTAGDLDPTFNPNGPTPGVLITGFQYNPCPDGSADGPFFQSVATTPDHHIVVAVNLCSTDGVVVGLMRLDETGALDEDFDGDGTLILENYTATVGDVAVDANERIYVAGLHCLPGQLTDCQVQHAYVTRFSSTGVRDQTFNAGGTIPGILEYVLQSGQNTRFNAIHVLSDFSSIAVGASSQSFLARISANGERVTTFGPAGDPPGTVGTLVAPTTIDLWDVTTTADESAFLVTGQGSDLNGATAVVAKLTATGALDTSFAPAASTPGVTTVPGGYHGSQVEVQPNDGKVVVMGWGPNATFSANRIMLARFGADGVLDSDFGTGGVVFTELGNFSVGLDGELQSDGKILLGGVRRVPLNDIAPVVVRYLGAATTPTPTPGGAGTATPTASGGTLSPTPVATPTDLPGEICGNCLDDESDGTLDREDPECPPRANGGGQGIGTPKVQGKAIAKCGKAIETAAAKFGTAHLRSLQTCGNAVFACVQTKPGDAKCPPKATGKCTKASATIAKDRGKLAAAIDKACSTAKGVALADVLAAAGLGFGAENQDCTVASFGTLADVATCVGRRHECAADHELVTEIPRAAELLLAGGMDPAESCVGSGPALGSGLADAARAKLAVKCQAAIAKAGLQFGSAKSKAIQSCLQATTGCVQEKPGDADCLASARAKCAKQVAGLTAPSGVEADLAAAVAKECSALTADELTSANGLGFQTQTVGCAALGTPSVATAAGVGDCVRREHECRVEQALEAATPRFQELLDLGGVTLP